MRLKRKTQTIDLLEQNKRKFGTDNLEIIKGLAPEALEGCQHRHMLYRRFFWKFKRNPWKFCWNRTKGACYHQCDCPGDGSRSDAVPQKSMAFTDMDITAVSGGKGKETGLLVR